MAWFKVDKERVFALLDSGRELTDFEAEMAVLCLVNYKASVVKIKGVELRVERGESVKSLQTWADTFKWTRSKVQRFFERLEKEGFISRENVGVTTKLHVVDYDLMNDNADTVTDTVTDTATIQKSVSKSVRYKSKKSKADTVTDTVTDTNIRSKEIKNNMKDSKESFVDETSTSDLYSMRKEEELSHTVQESIIRDVYAHMTKVFLKKRPMNPESKNSKHLRARIKEYDFKDSEILKGVVDLKFKEWKDDLKMKKYLRPETLFNAEKFEKYLDEYLDSTESRSINLSCGDKIESPEKLKDFDDSDYLIVDFEVNEKGVEYGKLSFYDSRVQVSNMKAVFRKNFGTYTFKGVA